MEDQHERIGPLLWLEDLRRYVPFSSTHLRRLEEKGQFPRRFYPTPGRCAWSRGEVEAWAAARLAERDTLPCRPLPPPEAAAEARRHRRVQASVHG